MLCYYVATIVNMRYGWLLVWLPHYWYYHVMKWLNITRRHYCCLHITMEMKIDDINITITPLWLAVVGLRCHRIGLSYYCRLEHAIGNNIATVTRRATALFNVIITKWVTHGCHWLPSLAMSLR